MLREHRALIGERLHLGCLHELAFVAYLSRGAGLTRMSLATLKQDCDATPPAATNDAPPAPSPATTTQLEGARRRLITAHGQRVSLELAPTSVAIARSGAGRSLLDCWLVA